MMQSGSNPTHSTTIKAHTANSSLEDCEFESHRAYIKLLAELVYAFDLKSNIFLFCALYMCSLDATGSVSLLQRGSWGFESLSEYQGVNL